MSHKEIEDRIIQSVVPNKGIVGIIMLIFVFVFCLIGGILYFIIGDNEIPAGSFPSILGWTPKTATALILAITSAIIGLFLLIYLIIVSYQNRKAQKIRRLLSAGDLREAVVVSNIQNFYIQINHVPQRIVQFKVGEELYNYKFFSEPWASHFPVGATIKIRCDRNGQAIPDTSNWN